MLTINGTKLNQFPVTGLKRVRDLMWLDGPVLSEYVHSNGDRYLYCWSDCDQSATRWMVFRVHEQSILRLASGKIPLDFVITKACQDDFVYFIDVLAGKKKETIVHLSRVADVPTEYLPQKGVFLDETESSEDGSYTVLLDGGWSPSELFIMPKSFEQAYSFIHAHVQLQVPTLEKLPWRGGFSSLHFDSWVRRTIPQSDRLGIEKVMLASPGFIKFSAIESTAENVAKCVESVSDDQTAKDVYSELTAFIRKNIPKHQLSHDEMENLGPQFRNYTIELAKAIGVIDADRLLASVKTPFEAAQILRWFFRRLHPLVAFVRSGRLEFVLERIGQ